MSFLDFRRPHVLGLLLLGCTVCDMFLYMYGVCTSSSLKVKESTWSSLLLVDSLI